METITEKPPDTMWKSMNRGVSVPVCTSTAQFSHLWLGEHFKDGAERFLKAKHQEVCCETVSHRNDYLNNTGTMPSTLLN